MDKRSASCRQRQWRLVCGSRFVQSVAAALFALSAAVFSAGPAHAGSSVGDEVPGYLHDAFGGPDSARFRPAYKVVQEPDGHLWIGAGAEVFRHDGQNVTLALPSKPGTENYIMLSEGDGSVWISQAQGLTGRLLRIRHGKTTAFKLGQAAPGEPAPLIYSTYRRRGGDLILGLYFGGLLRLTQSGVIERWDTTHGLPPGARVTSFAEDGSRLLVGTKAGVFWTADGRRFFPVTQVRDVMALVVRADGVILAGGASGVQRLERIGGGYRAVSLPWQVKNVSGFVEPVPGELWIATEGNGLAVLRDRQLLRISKAQGLLANTVFSISADREGNVWAATAGGIDRFSPIPFRAVFEARDTDRTPLAAVEDGDRNRWIGDDGGQIYVQTNGALTLASAAKVTGRITRLTARTRGAWFGTSSGLAGAISRLGKWQVTACYAEVDSILPLNPEVLLVACRGEGLKMVGRDGARAWLPQGNARAFAFVRTMARTANNDIWISDYESGLWRVRSGEQAGRVDASFGLVALSGRTSKVTALLANGNQLVAAGAGAVAVWDGQRFREYSSRAVACFTDTSSMMADGKDLWLGGRSGLARLPGFFEDAEASIRSGCQPFDGQTGYPGLAFARLSGPTMLLAAGEPWFVTTRGIVQYTRPLPSKVGAPTVIISDPVVDGRVATSSSLGPGVGTVQWSIHLLSFRVPLRAKLRYRIAGYERAWHVATQNASAIYTGLPPGTYTLEVEASDLNGQWATTRVSKAFEILPGFTETLTFFALVAVSLLLLAYLPYHFRSLSVRRRYAALMAERARIARDIHDTLLQDFSGAVWQVDAALKGKNRNAEQTVEQLTAMMPRFDAMLRDARQAVARLRHEPDESEPLCHSLEREVDALVQQLTQGTGLRVALSVNGLPRPLPSLVAQDLLAVVREAVTNVRKHARASKIEIITSYDVRGVAVSVADDGVGMTNTFAEPSVEGRWGLAGIRERIAGLKGRCEIVAREPTGTILRCHVPLAKGRKPWKRPSMMVPQSVGGLHD